MRYTVTLLVALVLTACGGTLIAESAGPGGGGADGGWGGAGGQIDAGSDGAEDTDEREMPDALPAKEAATP